MKQLSYLVTTGMGCLFLVGIIIVIGWLVLSASGYFWPCVVIGFLMAIPLGLLGALIGKILTNTGMGTWMGALVMVSLGIAWLSSNYSFCIFSV
jgi:hypothetical protein